MNSRERIQCAISHVQTDKLPVDFGGTMASGMHVSTIYKLRQRLGLDRPLTPVKVIEPFQMLGEICKELREIMGIDTIPLFRKKNFFGFENKDWKKWKLWDGTPLLVPGLFNTEPEKDGSIFMYPEGDISAPPCAKMPYRGYYFDLIIRQEKIDDSSLNVEDNLEEFRIISDEELAYLKDKADELYNNTKCSIVGNLFSSGFGDIGLIPGPALKYPKGIRDVTDWYASTVTKKEYIRKILDRQCEIAIKNYKKIYDVIGNKIDVACVTYADFGMQTGLSISKSMYNDLYKPFYKKVNGWIHENTTWKTFNHSCGSISELIPDFIEVGFDILNPVQVSAKDMDPATLKKEYGKYIAFWGGGANTQKTLPFGTPKEVKEEVKRLINIFSYGGGFIFSTVHNIQANIPIENIMAMIEVIQECRK